MVRRCYLCHKLFQLKILKNTSEISDMCHRAEEPIYITKNGYGDMVIMSMEIYESAMKQLAMYRDIEISEKQIEAGQVKDARTALRERKAQIQESCLKYQSETVNTPITSKLLRIYLKKKHIIK